MSDSFRSGWEGQDVLVIEKYAKDVGGHIYDLVRKSSA